MTDGGALPAAYSGLGVPVPPDLLAFLAARFSLREREAAFLLLRPPLSLFPISASDRAVLANGTTSFCHKSGHRGRHCEPMLAVTLYSTPSPRLERRGGVPVG